MDGVYSEIDGVPWIDEVMKAAATLGREVEDRGAAGGALGNFNVRGEFVGGVDQAAGCLDPWLETTGMVREVPTENYRRDACSYKSAAAYIFGVVNAVGGDHLRVRGRRKCQPGSHDVASQFETSAEQTGVNHWRQCLADLKAWGEKGEIVAVAEADTAIDERTIFPCAIDSIATLGIRRRLRIGGGRYAIRLCLC